MLAEWLLSAAEPEDIAARQAATSELAAKWEWRERLAAYGDVVRLVG